MCELRRDFDPIVAQGQHGTLFVQCLRLVPQNERHESTSNQNAPKIGKFLNNSKTKPNTNHQQSFTNSLTNLLCVWNKQEQFSFICQQWVK